jgi:hypothetical protein
MTTMQSHGTAAPAAHQKAQPSAVQGNQFDPMAVARETVLRRVARGPVHYGIVVECVRLSPGLRGLVSGYDTFHSLVMAGEIKIDAGGTLSISSPPHSGDEGIL